MDVYVFIGKDRHTDDEIKVFKTYNAAMGYLQSWVKPYEDRGHEIEELYDYPPHSEKIFLYGLCIGTEGDSACIEMHQLEN